MKTKTKSKTKSKPEKPLAKRSTGADMSEAIAKLEGQLAFIEKKIDNLIDVVTEQISKASELRVAHPPKQEPPPADRTEEDRQPGHESNKHGQKPYWQSAPTAQQGRKEFGSHFKGRKLFQAVCAECQKPCEIPFKPSPGRSVYCPACFSSRKNGGRNNQNFDRQNQPNVQHEVLTVASIQAEKHKKRHQHHQKSSRPDEFKRRRHRRH